MRMGMAALAALAGFTAATAQPPQMLPRPADGDIKPLHYARDAAWICRPGVDDGTCSTHLDALAVDTAGKRTPVPYVAATDPKVDCFYVYPTVSEDPTFYADADVGAEERRTVHGQLARLGAVCRLFAPVYHQMTMAGLHWAMGFVQRGEMVPEMKMDVPFAGVVAAWRHYLKHDNKGRGVILVGHSQGAMLLKRLIAEEIERRPAQKRIVAAYLAGNPDLTTASFKRMKPCATRAQTGCVVAWSSYGEAYQGMRFFGTGTATTPALCVNPASPGDGRAPIKAYLSKPRSAPPEDPPYVETIGQMSAECVSDDKGAVLRVRVEPGVYADVLNGMIARYAGAPGWGLHPLDIGLVQGNMIDMMTAQIAAWPAK